MNMPYYFQSVDDAENERYRILARSIGDYVKAYHSKEWKQKIGEVIPTFFITPINAKNLLEAHESSSLEQALENNACTFIREFEDIKEAIKEFFEAERHKD